MPDTNKTFATQCGVGATTLLNMISDGQKVAIDAEVMLQDMVELASRLNIATEALNSLGAIYLADKLEAMPGGSYEND